MKKLLSAGAFLLTMTALFLLVPRISSVGAATSDFVMEGTTLVSYTGTATTVSVPANVEVIGRSAFEENDKIKKIVIPKSVTTIEEYAFWGCENLETVVLGEGLYEVADFTFTACPKLTRVSIPDTINRIGIMAFADCTGLEEIYIPPTVTDIHETAFDGVPDLQIEAKQFSYPYRYALARGEKLENAPVSPLQTETPKPQEVPPVPTLQPTPQPTNRPIGDVMGSTTVVGHEAVVFIDHEEMEASYGEDVDIEAFQTQLLERKEIPEWCYYGDKTLHRMALPVGTLKIGTFAFARSNLERIELPHGLTTIEYAAFYHCDELEDISIPGTVTKIEAKAFTFTPWLEKFYAETSENTEDSDFLVVGDGVLLAYRGNVSKVVIPIGVKYIAAEAFLNHVEIEEVQFPDTIEAIDAEAFEGCTYKPAF